MDQWDTLDCYHVSCVTPCWPRTGIDPRLVWSSLHVLSPSVLALCVTVLCISLGYDRDLFPNARLFGVARPILLIEVELPPSRFFVDLNPFFKSLEMLRFISTRVD